MNDSPVRIFVSYSHSDEEYVDEKSDESLAHFLRGLKHEGVEIWYDRQIAAGDKWDDEIRNQIAQCDIALVLVSQSFLDSQYCTNVEIAGFLDRSKEGGLVIVPVILSPCEWDRHAWLRSTQYLPRDGHTIEEHYLDVGKRKRLFLDIKSSLREQIERRRESRRAAPPPAAAAPAKHAIGGERRPVTALQCELTAARGSIDPEELMQLLPEFRTRASEIVKRLDGHVAERQGRRLLAYFGYPRVHENDGHRAAIAASEIRTLAGSLGGAKKSLAMKVAIHSGSMVISSAAGDEEPMLVGDVPEVVAAMLNQTPANEIRVSEDTRDLIGKDYGCTEAGTIELPDIAPLTVFSVAHATPARTSGAYSTASQKTFVARDRELDTLRQSWELAREGEGQVVYIRGEAGLGKSRLVKEFTAEAMQEPVSLLKCQCSPYYQNTEFYPLIDLLDRTVNSTKEPGTPIEKLEALLRKVEMQLETAVPLLCGLLALPLPPGYQPVNLSPEGRKKNTLAAILDLVLRLAQRQPVLMIVEDLHWIDVSTVGFLDMLIRTQATAPILTVLTFRPEFDAPWRQLSYLSEISLRRLGSKEAGRLIAQLTEGKSLPQALLDEIVAKADGIPLFAEELTKMVTESEVVEAGKGNYQLVTGGERLAVPATLEGSLIARLDRLDTAKEIAQIASVIGREFFQDLLSQAASVEDAALVRDLDRLLQSEIILRRGLPSEASYLFKHALIQQAAYESILNRDARQLHGKIAQALESKFPDLADRQPELAAFHFTRAGMTEKAIEYWQRAAERSIKNSANTEAVAHLTKCLELLAELPEGRERDKREMKLRTALALPLIACKGYAADEVDEALRRARELCTEVGDDAELFRVLRLLWPFQTVRGNHPNAFEAAQQIRAMARDQDNASLCLEADRVLGSSYFYMGRLTEARKHFEDAINFYDRKRDHAHVLVYGQDPGVSCLSNEGVALWVLGYPEQALARGTEAIALARELGHPYSLCYSLFFCSLQYIYRRDLDNVTECVEEMLKVSRHQTFPFWETMGMLTTGWVNAHRGDPKGGVATMDEWIMKSLQRGAQLYFPTFYCMKTEAHTLMGDLDGALASVDKGLSVSAATGETFCAPELHRLRGDLLAVRTPGSPAAEEQLVKALEGAEAEGSKSFALRAAMSLARFRMAAGHEEEALNMLDKARNAFTEGGDTHDLRQADELLAQLRLVRR